jgi:hypothetical protein
MPRPATPQPIIDKIESMWAENHQPQAKRLYELVKSQVKGYPSLRKVQQVIRDAKRRAGPIADDPPLQPWGEGWPEAPEDIACLFRLMLCRLFEHPDATGLTIRQAKWALKLRGVFDVTGLDPENEYKRTYEHIIWANAYARRDRAAAILKRDGPYTADLDGVMMFRPWEGALGAYREAVRLGLVPGWEIENELEAMEVSNTGFSERYRQFERVMSQVVEEESHERHTETTGEGHLDHHP